MGTGSQQPVSTKLIRYTGSSSAKKAVATTHRKLSNSWSSSGLRVDRDCYEMKAIRDTIVFNAKASKLLPRQTSFTATELGLPNSTRPITQWPHFQQTDKIKDLVKNNEATIIKSTATEHVKHYSPPKETDQLPIELEDTSIVCDGQVASSLPWDKTRGIVAQPWSHGNGERDVCTALDTVSYTAQKYTDSGTGNFVAASLPFFVSREKGQSHVQHGNVFEWDAPLVDSLLSSLGFLPSTLDDHSDSGYGQASPDIESEDLVDVAALLCVDDPDDDWLFDEVSELAGHDTDVEMDWLMLAPGWDG